MKPKITLSTTFIDTNKIDRLMWEREQVVFKFDEIRRNHAEIDLRFRKRIDALNKKIVKARKGKKGKTFTYKGDKK